MQTVIVRRRHGAPQVIRSSAGPSFQSETCGCEGSHLEQRAAQSEQHEPGTLGKLLQLQKKRLKSFWTDPSSEQLLTSTSDGGFNQRIQLFISPDGELQVAWSDSLHLQILRCISCQLQDLTGSLELAWSTRWSEKSRAEEVQAYLGGEVLEDGGAVHRRCGSHPAVAGGSGLQVSVDSTHRELRTTINNRRSGESNLWDIWQREAPMNENWTDLKSCSLRARNSLCLGLSGVFPSLTASLKNTNHRPRFTAAQPSIIPPQHEHISAHPPVLNATLAPSRRDQVS